MDIRLSRFDFYADFVLTPVYVILGLAVAFAYGQPDWRWGWLFLIGVLVWTPAEYFIHRYVLHRLYRHEHGHHHRHPGDFTGPSSFLVGPIILALWFLCVGLMQSIGLGGMFFSGFVTGYYAYTCTHFMLHYTAWNFGWWRRYHDWHHEHWGENYGVLVPVWDMVFGTYRRV